MSRKKHIYEISCQSLPCLDQWQWILAPQNPSGEPRLAWNMFVWSNVGGKKKLASLAVSVDAQPLEVRQCYFIPINILLVVWNIFYFSIYWECDHPN
jgi:hypothetical protein